MAKSELGEKLHELLGDRDDLSVVLQDQPDVNHDKVSLVFLDGSREPFTVEHDTRGYVVADVPYRTLGAALATLVGY